MSYLHDSCLDEVALEGLDGITLACLWCRLAQRLPEFPLTLDAKAKQFLWGGLLAKTQVTFHHLPEPRDLPTFPHEYRLTDEATGIISLNEQNVRREYQGCIISSSENDGIQGSCSTFKDRVEISGEVRGQDNGRPMTLEEVQERWGDSLVLVASQAVRRSALLGGRGDPALDLSDIQFCLLEFVGRMRHHGANQTDFVRLYGISAKSIHSYRHALLDFGLVERRTCWWEMTKKAMNYVMLTLRRFLSFVKHGHMTRLMILSNLILAFLESQPDKKAKFSELVEDLEKKMPTVESIKDLKSCMRKSFIILQKMEVVKVVQAKGTQGADYYKLIKMPNEEKEDADEDASYDLGDPGHSRVVAELPMTYQTYRLIHNHPGIDYTGMQKLLQMEVRFIQLMVDKVLVKNNMVKFNVLDEGRQRVRKFHTVRHNKESNLEKIGDEIDGQTASSTPAQPEVPMKKMLSLRFMKRREKILELLSKNKVQNGCFGLLKELRMAEKLEGRVEICDKKSVERILDNMEDEGLCKQFSTVVLSDDGTMNKTVSFVTDADVAMNDPMVLHAIQQVKFRMIHPNLAENKPEEGDEAPTLFNRKRKLKLRLAVLSKARKAQKRKRKMFRDNRVTKYQTLAGSQSGHGATEATEAGQQPRHHGPSSTHDTLWGKGEGSKADDSEANEKTGRHYILARGVYGCLQKMERIRVLHRFVWYLVYGMPKQQVAEAPQPVLDEESRLPTVKQEFGDEDQSEVITKLEQYSQGALVEGDTPLDLDHPIGQYAAQSAGPSWAVDRTPNQAEVGMAGQGSRVADAMQRRSAEGQAMGLGSVDRPESETGTDQGPAPDRARAKPKTVASLFASIELGLESDSQTDSGEPAVGSPTPAAAAALKTERPSPSSSQAPLPPRPDEGAFGFLPLSSYTVYLDVMDWRRFMQPLPVYPDLDDGWCYLGDLILSMPLVLFCEVVPARYMIEGLDECLKDPIRRLLLIKDLPLKLRRRLLEGRRYLFMLEREIEKMSSLGLAIYTPHQQECKEMLSIYVCRNVSLVDTTSSKPSSYFVSEKQYPGHKHHLATLNDLEKFWFELKVICLNTPLGTVRSSVPPPGGRRRGKLTSYARTQESNQGPVVDDGRIPGDGRGAGGYDSSFYSHLKRNWTSDTINPHHMSRQRFQNRFQRNLCKIKHGPARSLASRMPRKMVPLTIRPGVREVVSVETELVEADHFKAGTAGGRGLKRRRVPAPERDTEEKAVRKQRRDEWLRRREEKRQAREDRKQHQRAKRAVGIVTRVVYSWTPAEDSVLLLCKVASAIFNKVLSYKNLVTWETVQQVFSKKLPNVSNLEKKDAKAVSKRSTRLMRYSEHQMNYSVCLGEVFEDKAVMDTVSPELDKDSQETIAEEFHKLVDRLEAKFRIAGIFSKSLPEDLSTLHRDYTVEAIAKEDATNKMFFKEENMTDLRRLALHTIVHSTLSAQTASDYDARSSFKLFEQFDSNLLHDVFLFCRSKGLVSRSLKSKARRRIVPQVPITYQLSTAYAKRFNMNKIPQELPAEVVACYTALLESAPEEGVILPQVSCGAGSCQISLILADEVKCQLIVPKQVILLDSNLIDKEFLEQSGLLRRDSSDSEDSDSGEGSAEDEDEDQDGRRDMEGGASLDLRATVEGAEQEMMVTTSSAEGRRGPGGVVVVFEEDGGEEEEEEGKPKSGAGTGGSGRTAACSDDAVERIAGGESRAMEALSTLADGVLSGNSELPASKKPETPMAPHHTATNLDHSYFLTAGSVATDNQTPGDCPQEPGRPEGCPVQKSVSESVGGVLDVPRASSASEGLSEERPGDNLGEAGDTGPTAPSSSSSSSSSTSSPPAPVQAGPMDRSHMKTVTMKCMKTSQSSFTKWLILQGHYAPGVCDNNMSVLQENIAFNAFTVRLTRAAPGEPRPGGPAPPESQPACSSLSEFLLRPCESLNLAETLCVPDALCPQIDYLQSVYDGKYIHRKDDDTQDLTQRCAQQGLDRPSTTFILSVYRKIEEAGFLGLALTEVKRAARRAAAETGSPMPLVTCINTLLQQHMIWEVGSNELRLVATQFASLWAIQSQRLVNASRASSADPGLKRRRLDTPHSQHPVEPSGEPVTVDLTVEQSPTGHVGTSEPESPHQLTASPKPDRIPAVGVNGQQEVVDPSTAVELTAVGHGETAAGREGSDGDVDAARGDGVRGSPSPETSGGQAAKRKLLEVIDGIYEPIEFVPYPWRKVNGEINRPALFRMMRGIALFVLAEPGMKEDRLLLHFKDVFRRVDTLKLLQMMSDLGLVTRHCIRPSKPCLFSRTRSGRRSPVYYYLPSVNCLTIMGALFNHQE